MSDGALPQVTAVMLAYGAEPWLHEAVSAVLGSTGVDVELILVDNGCTSDAVDAVKSMARLTVLRPTENLGYAGGCMIGAAEATGDYLAFVNSDAVVAPDALAKLIRVAAEPGVGLAMGSIRLADRPDHINTAGNPWHVAGLSWAGGNGSPVSEYADRRQVAVGSGCCFVVRREVWHAVRRATAASGTPRRGRASSAGSTRGPVRRVTRRSVPARRLTA